MDDRNKKDILLLKTTMNKFHWNQSEVAQFLGIYHSQISRVLRNGQHLHPSSRKLLTFKTTGKYE
jgi:transcriptional regulator with XRE-family HTH domain